MFSREGHSPRPPSSTASSQELPELWTFSGLHTKRFQNSLCSWQEPCFSFNTHSLSWFLLWGPQDQSYMLFIAAYTGPQVPRTSFISCTFILPCFHKPITYCSSSPETLLLLPWDPWSAFSKISYIFAIFFEGCLHLLLPIETGCHLRTQQPFPNVF